MEEINNPYDLQLFVCTNKKEKGACCADKGAVELRNDLKSICREKFGKRVRVNAAGCMGGCEKGIMAAIYPQNKWFELVDIQDKEKLLDTVHSILEEK
ncbi:MAG: (2Fe-2S) ferredoxin domain-containing protein [Bdellovibrionales bacterium]|nr:(2Fe-2S) ferredoxin domain-containing protein [Bdellovibrionales bacterium]